MCLGQKQGTRTGGVGVDRPSVGWTDAGQRAIRGSAKERRRVMQPDQQDLSGFGEKDTDQGHELSVNGEHSKVSILYTYNGYIVLYLWYFQISGLFFFKYT